MYKGKTDCIEEKVLEKQTEECFETVENPKVYKVLQNRNS